MTKQEKQQSRLSLEDRLPALFEELAGGATLPGGLPRELYPEDSAPLLSLLAQLLPDPAAEEPAPAGISAAIRGFTGGSGPDWTSALLPHLRTRPHPAPPAEKRGEAWALLLRLLEELDRKWIDAADFAARYASRAESARFLDGDYAADYLYYESRGAYRNYLGDSGQREEQCYLDSPERLRDAYLTPLAFGGLGLLFLLGALEVEYRPGNRRYTPWEGIVRFRPSGWGSYLLDPEQAPPVWRPSPVIRLAREGELARIEGPSPRAEALLRRIGTPVAPACYRITPSSIFTACPDHEALAEELDLLRRLSREPIPPAWEELFTDLGSRSVKLKPEEDYRIFSFDADREFLTLLSRREELTGLYLKVEGGRIAVRQRDMELFLMRLRSAGCLAVAPKKEDPPQ